MEIISYKTPEFKEFVNSVKVSLEEAWDIQLKYYEKHNQKIIGAPLFFIINKKYIFTPYYNSKIPEVRIKGVAVDSMTGKAEYMDTKIKLKPKSQFGWKKE